MTDNVPSFMRDTDSSARRNFQNKCFILLFKSSIFFLFFLFKKDRFKYTKEVLKESSAFLVGSRYSSQYVLDLEAPRGQTIQRSFQTGRSGSSSKKIYIEPITDDLERSLQEPPSFSTPFGKRVVWIIK